ncbi:hypothetical protein KJ980_01895 [Patescibacteria group bacterium]|nr:hypothetical protein [Patescibacteria group bacterium]MBU4016620.1 hypothetical protein [Patescibacteria group bacterium]MBU4098381.1 hypothetical protein [Patescibacteria group bacterium]
MYAPPPNDNKIYQGDIFENCSFYIPHKPIIQGTTLQAKYKEYSGSAMVLTQSCDIQDDDGVHLVVIITKDEFRKRLLDKGKEEGVIGAVLGKLESKKTHYKLVELFE